MQGYQSFYFLYVIIIGFIEGEVTQCPADMTAVVSPLTGLAHVGLTFGGVLHRLSLPIGTYHYDTFDANGFNCSLTVRISGILISSHFQITLVYVIRNRMTFATFYIFKTLSKTCHVLRFFSDYNIKRRLVMSAEYDVKCDLLSNPITNSTLNSMINSHFQLVDGICMSGRIITSLILRYNNV